MRTTIEISNEQRAALLALAAHRGLRGYSSLISEALTKYLGLPPARSTVKEGEGLVSFLNDGFSTNRPDGSEKHDDHIYRSK